MTGLNPLAQAAAFDELDEEQVGRNFTPRAATRNVPWKAVALALFLLSAGSLLLLVGTIVELSSGKNGLALFLIGAVMFMPGAYHSILAYKAFMGRPGFSFAALPDV